MSGGRRLLLLGGIALAAWGMGYGLWYAVFAEHQALNSIGFSLRTVFDASASRNPGAAETAFSNYKEAEYVYDRQVDVHGHWIGLAMLLMVVGIAFDRVRFAERYKLMLASTLVSGAVIFPFGVFAADLQSRSDPARDRNHRFGAGDCCAHRNHAWVGRPPSFCGVALTNHSSLSHLEFSKRVEVAGVKAQAQDVTLQVGQIVTLKLNLVVGEVSEQVVVEAATEVTEPTRTQITEVITESQIENLPVNGREFIDFAPLSPGVQIGDTTSGSTDVIVEPVTQLSFAGQNIYFNFIVVDGADDISTASGIQRGTPPQELVQEFRVIKTDYTTEYGRATAGIVQSIRLAVRLRPGNDVVLMRSLDIRRLSAGTLRNRICRLEQMCPTRGKRQ
jgi:hypothetical protein